MFIRRLKLHNNKYAQHTHILTCIRGVRHSLDRGVTTANTTHRALSSVRYESVSKQIYKTVWAAFITPQNYRYSEKSLN